MSGSISRHRPSPARHRVVQTGREGAVTVSGVDNKTNNEPSIRRGRRAESSNVRLRPVFREEPDIEKLSRAIVSMIVRDASLPSQRQSINPANISSDPTIAFNPNRSYDRGHLIEEEVGYE